MASAELSRSEAAEVRSRCRFPVDLNFFGMPVRLHVTSAYEADQWLYFYKHHLGAAATPEIEVFFEVVGQSESFIESIFRKNYSSKAMYVSRGDAMYLWAEFDTWSSVPSPLPPYTTAPLNERVWALNASAVRTAKGQGCVFVAPPYQGKSTLANAVIREGGAPLSDNVTMLDRAEGTILPYLTPTGIREETLKKLPGLPEAVARMKMPFVTVSEVTGPVYLLHFDEIQECAASVPTEPAMVVLLRDVGEAMRGSYRLDELSAEAARRELTPLIVDTCISDADARNNLSVLLEKARVCQLTYDLANCDIAAVVTDCFG